MIDTSEASQATQNFRNYLIKTSHRQQMNKFCLKASSSKKFLLKIIDNDFYILKKFFKSQYPSDKFDYNLSRNCSEYGKMWEF